MTDLILPPEIRSLPIAQRIDPVEQIWNSIVEDERAFELSTAQQAELDRRIAAHDAIRLKLKEIVEAEDKSDPLSDEALMNELQKQGYPLARRTVTKYRKIMNIPSSRHRRGF